MIRAGATTSRPSKSASGHCPLFGPPHWSQKSSYPKHLGTIWPGPKTGQRMWPKNGVFGQPSIALPDTELNQDDYPQPSQQKPGCGFPVLRLVAFMSLSTGAVSRYRLGNLHDHEQCLFQDLRTHLKADDMVLGDRNFGTFQPRLAQASRRRWRLSSPSGPRR